MGRRGLLLGHHSALTLDSVSSGVLLTLGSLKLLCRPGEGKGFCRVAEAAVQARWGGSQSGSLRAAA